MLRLFCGFDSLLGVLRIAIEHFAQCVASCGVMNRECGALSEPLAINVHRYLSSFWLRRVQGVTPKTAAEYHG